MSDEPTPPAPPPATPPATPPSNPWEGVDSEILGHMQNRGWDKLDPKAAAVEAVKAQREAARFVGAPPERLIKLPADPADETGWKEVWSKLGVPADKDGYDLSEVKKSDGTPVDQAFTDFIRANAAELHLPKDAAPRLAQALTRYQEDAQNAALADVTERIEADRAELKKNWGQNYEANQVIAKSAAEKFGIGPDIIEAIGNAAGLAKTMEFFLKIGVATGESRFVSSGAGAEGVMSREQAIATRAELKADPAWAARYLAGGADERRRMAALNRIIVGDDTDASRYG